MKGNEGECEGGGRGSGVVHQSVRSSQDLSRIPFIMPTIISPCVYELA